jgi:hypothetical protein
LAEKQAQNSCIAGNHIWSWLSLSNPQQSDCTVPVDARRQPPWFPTWRIWSTGYRNAELAQPWSPTQRNAPQQTPACTQCTTETDSLYNMHWQFEDAAQLEYIRLYNSKRAPTRCPNSWRRTPGKTHVEVWVVCVSSLSNPVDSMKMHEKLPRTNHR